MFKCIINYNYQKYLYTVMWIKGNFVKNRILLLALYRSQRNISKEQKGKTGHSIDWQRK